MATMATFPPVHHAHENLSICPVPSDILDNDLQHLWSLMNPYPLNFEEEFPTGPLDLSILSDIPDENGSLVDPLYNPQTDLGAQVGVNTFQTPPTPEPEPDFVQKFSPAIQAIASQPQQMPSHDLNILNEGNFNSKEREPTPPMEIQHGEPRDSTVSERKENNELEHKKNLLPKVDQKPEIKTEEEEEEDNGEDDRPARRCHTRYALRNIIGGSSNKPCRPTVRKTVVLWKFLEELLDKGEENCVSWVSKEEGTFKFVDSKLAAKLWGQRKNKRNMTYEKLSRALRYYYDRRIMFHEEGQKLIYRFGEVVMKNRRPSTEESSSPIVNETM